MAASQKILDFFNERTFLELIGRESNLTIEFDPKISKNDGFMFNNREVDSLQVDTIGKCKFTHIVTPLVLIDSNKVFNSANGNLFVVNITKDSLEVAKNSH